MGSGHYPGLGAEHLCCTGKLQQNHLLFASTRTADIDTVLAALNQKLQPSSAFFQLTTNWIPDSYNRSASFFQASHGIKQSIITAAFGTVCL